MVESYAEKRTSPRQEVEIEARLKRGDDDAALQAQHAIILNISEGGIFLKTDQPLDLKDEIECEFIWPDTDRPCMVKGTVLWRKLIPPRGVGIQLSRINNRPVRPY